MPCINKLYLHGELSVFRYQYLKMVSKGFWCYLRACITMRPILSLGQRLTNLASNQWPRRCNGRDQPNILGHDVIISIDVDPCIPTLLCEMKTFKWAPTWNLQDSTISTINTLFNIRSLIKCWWSVALNVFLPNTDLIPIIFESCTSMRCFLSWHKKCKSNEFKILGQRDALDKANFLSRLGAHIPARTL